MFKICDFSAENYFLGFGDSDANFSSSNLGSSPSGPSSFLYPRSSLIYTDFSKPSISISTDAELGHMNSIFSFELGWLKGLFLLE